MYVESKPGRMIAFLHGAPTGFPHNCDNWKNALLVGNSHINMPFGRIHNIEKNENMVLFIAKL